MITIWHNPRCSKSRAALALLQEAGVAYEERRYLEDTPSVAELRVAQAALGLRAIEMMRVKEAAFRERGLSRDMDEDALIAAMAAEPKLIERPMVFGEGRAVIGRPTEKVNEVL